MDGAGYLQRQSDELSEQTRQGADTPVLRSQLEGAARALEAAGLVDRSLVRRVLRRFDDQLVADGLVDRRGFEIAPGEQSMPVVSRAPDYEPVLPVPRLLGVQRLGLDVGPVDDGALVLLCLARWSDGFDVSWAVVGGVTEEDPRAMSASAAWWRRIEFVDDLGTGYVMRGASSHGVAPRRMGDFRAGPAIPDGATVLTMQLHDADDQVATRVDIELDAP